MRGFEVRRWSRCIVLVLVLSLIVIAAACDSPSRLAGDGSGRHIAASALSGDQQLGRPAQQLDAPVRLRILDAAGLPVAGVVVAWTTVDGGIVSPSQSITDDNGIANALWTLGPLPGRQAVEARAGAEPPVVFTATAVANTGATITVLQLSTYDGAGQSVHPDYVGLPASWVGSRQFLALTPYPNGNASFENPSLYTATTNVDWSAPAGVRNPIVSPSRGYLSDPDILYVAEQNELWLYYRQVDAENQIYVVRSSDGVHFGAPTLVAHAANHDIVSPAVVHRALGEWLMWSVNSNSGCAAQSTFVEVRRSSNGLDWSPPEKVELAQPGFSPWHIDVQWIPSRNEFWAVYNGKQPGSCTTPALFLATSPDGVKWKTYPSPLLSHGVIPEFQDVVYRSTFAFEAATDMISFWYSGARYASGTYVWKSAFQQQSRAEVFASLARTPGALALRALVATRAVPPLLDAP